MTVVLRELKSRKAKFGFDGGKITIGKIVELGKFISELQTHIDPDTYSLEQAGYSTPEIRIYTDDPVAAEWIRSYIF